MIYTARKYILLLVLQLLLLALRLQYNYTDVRCAYVRVCRQPFYFLVFLINIKAY